MYKILLRRKALKEFISIILFFVFFSILNKLVFYISSPTHLVVFIVIWVVIGLISLVVCKIIYDKFENKDHHYLPPKRRTVILFCIVIVAVALYSYKHWDQYREKSIETVLDTEHNPQEIIFKKSSNDYWKTEDPETIQELMSFLDKYQIKKSKYYNGGESEWDIDLIWTTNIDNIGMKMVNISITDYYVWINFTDQYSVINGPVDVDWLENYFTRNRDTEN
jgi:hypothetical protein